MPFPHASPRRHRTNEAPAAPLLLQSLRKRASDAPLELVAQLRAVPRDSPLLDSFNSNDARRRARPSSAAGPLGDDITRGFHGTTTVAFQYRRNGLLRRQPRVAGDARGSAAKKSSPSQKGIGDDGRLGGDCVSWLRLLSAVEAPRAREWCARRPPARRRRRPAAADATDTAETPSMRKLTCSPRRRASFESVAARGRSGLC